LCTRTASRGPSSAEFSLRFDEIPDPPAAMVPEVIEGGEDARFRTREGQDLADPDDKRGNYDIASNRPVEL